MAEIPTTQRAYTLRLRGLPGDESWREQLWRTHEAVNRGAQVFGDWLLTLRGGLSHELVNEPEVQPVTDEIVEDEFQKQCKTAIEKEKSPPTRSAVHKQLTDKWEQDVAARLQRITDRRIVLALSWLSVESDPSCHAVQVERLHVVATLETLLREKQLSEDVIGEWIEDCGPSLRADIREGAVWVNRAAMFTAAQQPVGESLTSDEIWDLLERFFDSREAYFEGLVSPKSSNEQTDDDDESEEPAKDLAIKAGGWLSNRFGTGTGSDFSSKANEYIAFARWCESQVVSPGNTSQQQLAELTAVFETGKLPRRLAATSGPSNRVQTAFQSIVETLVAGNVATLDFFQLAQWANDAAKEKQGKVGAKGNRPWATALLRDVEMACHMTYLSPGGSAAKHWEFAVMLDHAARRLCQSHSWIKLAETSRRQFEVDARRIGNVPDDAKQWLDAYCATRKSDSGSLDEYWIRKSALGGWKEIVAKWKQIGCQSTVACVTTVTGICDEPCSETKRCALRVQAAREVQADPDLDKFGDIQLFEALASDDACCVWHIGGEHSTKPLEDYVFANTAVAKGLHFKVPAFRHPDPLRHPVFCDFGNSRWSISFAIHQRRTELSKQEAAIERAETIVTKAIASLHKAKTPEKLQIAQGKISDSRMKLDEARDETAWLQSDRGLRLQLWDGQALKPISLHWSSNRLMADLAIQPSKTDDAENVEVSRADRLGRAAVSAKQSNAVSIAALFDQEHWNGRLQAPRQQLDDIADIRDGLKGKWKDKTPAERQREVDRRLAKINWLVSFSARLQPHGPWIEFAPTRGLNPDPVYYPHATENKKRKSRGRRVLSHIPGLRVLSVDLGHRFAAACAVWETMTSEQVTEICRNEGVAVPGDNATYWLVPRASGKGNIAFRRIGAETLPDGTETHPAPWARMERQFLVKLAGEDEPARWATDEEQSAVREFEKAVGFKIENRSEPSETKEEGQSGDKSPHSKVRVDELMARAVNTARLALRRHGDYARVAMGLKGDVRTLPGGRQVPVKPDELSQHLSRVVGYWHSLAAGDRWSDSFAENAWSEMLKEVGWTEPVAAISRQTGKKQKEEIEKQLAQIAARWTPEQRAKWIAQWTAEWQRRDRAWNGRLKCLRGWIMGRGGKKRARHKLRNVGGLSLRRIDTMKSLHYQVQKAFFTRLHPDGSKETAKEGFGRRTLEAMERLRENRVKQLSSRIVEAALGVGKESKSQDRRDVTRPRERVFDPCHAVVIENLRRYKPDEKQTRRENRQLMNWSAGQVRKYLSEGCQLHGLHLREVSPAYTSRQDFRTGVPGCRCTDVSVADFLREGSFWQSQVNQAKAEKDPNTWQQYLLAQHQLWSTAPETTRRNRCVRIPKKGGDLFVPSQVPTDARGHRRWGSKNGPTGVQADLNAAANIGLKALLDPDWAGSWWYIPAIRDAEQRWIANPESTAGSAALEDWNWQPVASVSTTDSATGKRARKPKKEKEFVNLWQFPEPRLVPLASATWFFKRDYWDKEVIRRVAEVLSHRETETPF